MDRSSTPSGTVSWPTRKPGQGNGGSRRLPTMAATGAPARTRVEEDLVPLRIPHLKRQPRRQEEYPEWLARTGPLLERANRHLDAAERPPPGREEYPGTKTLRGLTAALNRSLREDMANIERIEDERARERSRQQDRSRDRGFSW